MSNETVDVKAEDAAKESPRKPGPLYDALRKVMLAGIGAVVVAQDELENLVDKLVERGELAEKDARKLVQEVMDRREKLEQDRRDLREKEAERRARTQYATKTEIDNLTARIAELTKEIEALHKEGK